MRECTVHGRKRWRVTWRAAGRTVRRVFATKEAALTHWSVVKAEMAQAGPAFAALTSGERSSLLDAYRRAQQRGYSLSQACDAYEAQAAPGASGIALAELVARHLAASKANMRSNSYGAKRRTLEALCVAFAGRPAQSLTAAELRAYIAAQEWGAWRTRGFLIDASALFNWGIRDGLLVRNPTAAISRPPLDDGAPEILTVETVQKLLDTVPKLATAPLALGAFAGLRTSEIERLRWEHIRWLQNVIEISPRITKTRQRRLVPILPALDRWLSPVVQKSGRVFSRAAWLEFKASHRWPKNALRHSWISYRLAIEKDVNAVAIEAGNSPEIIFRNYRELVTVEDARRWFSL